MNKYQGLNKYSGFGDRHPCSWIALAVRITKRLAWGRWRLAPILLFGACQLAGPDYTLDDTTVLLETDQDSYTARCEGEGHNFRCRFEIVTQLENRSGRSLYLERCNCDANQPIYGIGMVGSDSGEKSAYNWYWACSGGVDPFTVRHGETRIDTIRIGGPNSFQGSRYSGSLTGQMRLQYSMFYCRTMDSQCQVSDDLRSTNLFDVSVE